MRYATLLSLAALLATQTPAVAAGETGATAPSRMKRFMVVRTFAPGALDGLDAEAKRKVNATNDLNGARWIQSYANADRTKTFCVYEGRDEEAIRKAARANGIPVDEVIEIPVDLSPR